MSFKLINALAIFQRYMSQILSSVLEKKILIYLNNILIASKTKKKHKRKVKKVKRLFTEAKLVIKEEKCKYFKKKLKFLGFKLIKEKIEKDSQKIEIIQNWKILQNLK